MEHEREWFLLSVRRGFTQTPLSLLWKLSKKPRVSDSHSGRVFTISLQPVCWQKRVHWNSFYRCQIDLTMPFKIWQKIWQVLHLLVLLLASETLLFCEIVVRNPSFESYLSESTCLSQRLVCTQEFKSSANSVSSLTYLRANNGFSFINWDQIESNIWSAPVQTTFRISWITKFCGMC